jgi:phenylpropionate dioxygenase-like ring-hydroxylating dioxygenase large terminal subunit
MASNSFLRDQWYVAARSDEVGAKPLGRVICNEPIVLYRAGNGQVSVLEDRCPHRMARLSLGEVVGDEIQCGYHGARFRGNGDCTLIPSQKDLPIPRGFGVRSFPVIETYALVFIWVGEAEKADPALIPEWVGKNTAQGWKAVHGYHHVKGNYQLVIDNLLDLSHVTYTHKTTLAGPGVDDTPMDVEIDGEVVRTSRVIRNVDPAPIHRAIKGFTGKIDRWQNSQFEAPIYILVTLGAEIAGTTEKLIEPTHLVINAATPETDTTTHYFWSVTRPFDIDNEALSKKFLEITYTAFDEDAAVIEEQQKMIDTAPPGAALVNFRGDNGGAAARRVMRRKLDQQVVSAVAAA